MQNYRFSVDCAIVYHDLSVKYFKMLEDGVKSVGHNVFIGVEGLFLLPSSFVEKREEIVGKWGFEMERFACFGLVECQTESV